MTSPPLVKVTRVTSTAHERTLRDRAAARLIQMPEDDDLEAIWKGRNGPQKKFAVLATSVQLDAFTKVKAAMGEMIATLKTQQEEEVTFKANCVENFKQDGKETFEKQKKHKDLVHSIEDLTATIERLTDEIAEAKDTIANMEIEIKKAGENRAAENAQYQTTVAEQRATQEIVKKALARMQAFYKKKALLQDGQDPMPPVEFKKQKENAGGSPVISMLKMIIEGSKAVEVDAIKEEQTAQKDYETCVNDSNDTIKQLGEQIVAKTEEKGAAEVDKENDLVSKKNAEDGATESMPSISISFGTAHPMFVRKLLDGLPLHKHRAHGYLSDLWRAGANGGVRGWTSTACTSPA